MWQCYILCSWTSPCRGSPKLKSALQIGSPGDSGNWLTASRKCVIQKLQLSVDDMQTQSWEHCHAPARLYVRGGFWPYLTISVTCDVTNQPHDQENPQFLCGRQLVWQTARGVAALPHGGRQPEPSKETAGSELGPDEGPARCPGQT